MTAFVSGKSEENGEEDGPVPKASPSLLMPLRLPNGKAVELPNVSVLVLLDG